ncbi:hypothetical protein TNCV_4311101 [Trichonephila clavipes]|nr:hypothetical protein TNCV_4311101 [Trichonephila clavipes]
MSPTDDLRSEKLSHTFMNDAATVMKGEDFILLDQKATLQKTYKPFIHSELSYGSEWKVIDEELYMSQVSAYWVPLA